MAYGERPITCRPMAGNIRKAIKLPFISLFNLGFLALSTCQSDSVPGTDGLGPDNPTDADGPGLLNGKASGLIIHKYLVPKGRSIKAPV